ncbi:MAG: peptidoglycan endopeptidase [Chloroflexota bacterium]|nr:MAG: peptidoglycan endopeptidase [Chloroflexota bacterium]
MAFTQRRLRGLQHNSEAGPIFDQLHPRGPQGDPHHARQQSQTNWMIAPITRVAVAALVGLGFAAAVAASSSPQMASASIRDERSVAVTTIDGVRHASLINYNQSASGRIAAPTPTEAPVSPMPVETFMHVVEEGETLRTLAKKYRVSRESIRQVNNLESDTLWIGQHLLIPFAPDTSPTLQANDGDGAPSEPPQFDQDTSDDRTSTSDSGEDSGRTVSSRGGVRSDIDPSGEADLVSSDPAPSDTTPNDFGDEVAQLALQLVGYRYRWAGASPSTGFDCSGLVYYVYQQAGRPIPRTLWAQLESGPRVSRDALQPGDIIYFANTYMPGLSHDGIYIGDGNFVDAVSEGVGVIVNSLSNPYWSYRFYAANRP